MEPYDEDRLPLGAANASLSLNLTSLFGDWLNLSEGAGAGADGGPPPTAGTTTDELLTLYMIFVPFMVLFCLASVLFNMVLLLSVCWIQKPISPTLHITLSLAGSDMFTSFNLGFGLFVNSYLPRVHGIKASDCFALLVEAFRLGGLCTTTAHLVLLAINHCLGTFRPLHYPSIVTHGNISFCLVVIWLAPSAIFLLVFTYGFEGEGFQSPVCSTQFFYSMKYRSMVSWTLFVAIALISVIYFHIYLMVKRHQATRRKYRSTYSRNYSYSRRERTVDGLAQAQQERNEKAICTTLLIVGSVVLGLLPVATVYTLVCPTCLFQISSPKVRFYVIFAANFLMILKSTVNSYIYAARMQDIKRALRSMCRSFKALICRRGESFRECRIHHTHGSTHSRSLSRHERKTEVCRLHSNPLPETTQSGRTRNGSVTTYITGNGDNNGYTKKTNQATTRL
ncbi:unnamed protein product [Bemisia tabaci]|uniref:G-protein coupled receptors family 1 profile domain-containing protein n=1 Tax=Bemisia tabaci TaxID=7038 RepID=A0A9P0A2J5_BEMTA|nr:PREDICTED: trace amine-associated receptor 8b-like [Bemisia tabaci]CAH0383058.1 unnamed protein product [Bemisia tabaci]